MKLQLGYNILDTFVENLPSYQAKTGSTKKKEMKYEALGEMFAYLMIRNKYHATDILTMHMHYDKHKTP